MAEKKPKEERTDEFPDEESKEIMEEIGAEKGSTPEGESGGEEKPKEETPETPEEGAEKKEETPPEEGEKAGEGEEKEKGKIEEEGEKEEGEEKPKRTPTLMPAYQHKIAEDKWNKEKEELQGQISELKKQVESKSSPEKGKAIEEFAEKHGFTSESVSELVDLIGKSVKPATSPDIESKIKEMEDKKEWDRQEEMFGKEYEEKISSLAKQDGVSADKQEGLKRALHDLAFSTKYAGNDLDEVYTIAKAKGYLDDYLPKKPGKKSAEGSRGGARGEGGEKSISEMTDEEFDQWSEEREKSQSQFSITRQGREISP